MTMTDPVADLLTRIRNANNAFHEKVDLPASKLKEEVVKILKKEGFINDYKFIESRSQGILRVYLKYTAHRERVISGLKRVSKPSLRTYVPCAKLPRVMGGLGVVILSTSRGVMTDKEARKVGVGGEILCYVW